MSTSTKTKPTRQRVTSPKVKAESCPNCNAESTRVYKTDGRTRRCVCDHCGSTWKQTGPFADELREYALQFAESLQKADFEEVDGQRVVLIGESLVKELEQNFRRLAVS